MTFQEIQRDPDVCNNCFRRTHQRFERNYARRIKSHGSESFVYWEEVDLPDDVIPIDGEVTRVEQNPDARGTAEACACGFLPGEKLRPLEKDTFIDFGENLWKRLDEYGLQISKQRFIAVLRDLKSDPDNQFADDRLYKKATERVTSRTRMAAGD